MIAMITGNFDPICIEAETLQEVVDNLSKMRPLQLEKGDKLKAVEFFKNKDEVLQELGGLVYGERLVKRMDTLTQFLNDGLKCTR